MKQETGNKRVARARIDVDVYNALEKIVGPDRISEDRAVVETYSKYAIGPDSYLYKHKKDGRYIPACIILPETTQEVQAIMRVLNEYRIAFLPFTNGQALSNPTLSLPTVCIHFSKMDKILDINEENRTITVQPYVDYAMVNAEAQKKGLWNGGTSSAGSITKIASHFAFAGIWHTDLQYGGMSRNVVSVKLVLPTGETLETGSSCQPRAGSFYESGPGPNLLGLFRSSLGTLGVVVEITVKLHKWAGPKVLETPKEHPSLISWEDYKYERVDMPAGYRVYWIENPDVDSQQATIHAICRQGIGIGITTMGAEKIISFCARTRERLQKNMAEGLLPGSIIMNVHLGAITSEKQLGYEVQVLEKVVSENGGKILSKDYKPEVLKELVAWNLDTYRCYYTFRGFRSVGNKGDHNYALGTIVVGFIDTLKKMQQNWEDVQNTFGPKAREMSVTPKSRSYIVNKGHYAYAECGAGPSPMDTDGMELIPPIALYQAARFIKTKDTTYPAIGVPVEPFTTAMPEVGPNNHLLLRKIRNVFDPNGIAAPGRQVFTEKELAAIPEQDLKNINKIRGLAGLMPMGKEDSSWLAFLFQSGKSWFLRTLLRCKNSF